jgi:hypothetical protein
MLSHDPSRSSSDELIAERRAEGRENDPASPYRTLRRPDANVVLDASVVMALSAR